MTPAPIFMSTYRRLDHVKKSLDALAKNPLASQSTLYLSSDGPHPEHRDEVFEVRRHLESVEGFGEVKLHFFEENKRRQIWDLRRHISKTHGRYIYLEEDCITAPGFLQYLNTSLTRYEDDPQVLAIIAYTPSLPEMAGPELRNFRVPCSNVWGFSTWEDRDHLVRPAISTEDYMKTLRSPVLRRRAFESLGVPFIGMLGKVSRKELFGYDIMANYEIIKRDLVCIFPSQSLIRNIGFDGSGEHCGTSSEYQVNLYDENRDRWDDIEEVASPEVNRAFGRFHGTSLKNRLRFYSKWLRGKLT